jgi:23S rRNA (uracil1939-C5)-methyltransferase
VELRLTRVTLDGDAVGVAPDGAEVRVQGGIPGERVLVELATSGRGPARLVRVLEPSPQRVRPPCPHFGPCGGCAWQHLAYPEQLRLKQGLVADLLSRAVGQPVAVRPTLGIGTDAAPASPGELDPTAPWGFRNKVHFVLGPAASGRGVTLGHYRRGTQTLLPITTCPVHAPEGNRLAFATRDALDRRGVPGTDERHPAGGVVRHVLARTSEATGQTQLTLVARQDRFRGQREVQAALLGLERPPTGLHLNVHDRPGPYILGPETRCLHGRERLLEEVAGAKFLISAPAFFQTSARAAARLVEAVLARIPADRTPVLDLFSGVGLFSIPLARRGHEVLAVEENAAAVRDGVASLRLNDLAAGACRFVAERAELAVRRLADQAGGRAFPTVVVDPPRDGCPAGLLEAVFERLRPARLVYVSCNLEALAQDLGRAARLGWGADDVQPVDMFPHTPHVETVVVLSPRAAGRPR